MLHRRYFTGFWMNIAGFSIHQNSEYLRTWICQHSEYTGVLNMLDLQAYQGSKYVRVTQGSKRAWICLNNSWICLIMSEMSAYVKICGSMREYTQICLNSFCFTFPPYNSLSNGIIGCFLEQTKFDFF